MTAISGPTISVVSSNASKTPIKFIVDLSTCDRRYFMDPKTSVQRIGEIIDKLECTIENFVLSEDS